MGTLQGYSTLEDAMGVADEVGTRQYWMNYRIVFIDEVGNYDYTLLNRQDWRSLVSPKFKVVAHRAKSNAFPDGFTNWTYE